MIKYGLDTEKVYTNNSGLDYIVFALESSRAIHVKFLKSGYESIFRADHVRSGLIKDKLNNSVYGNGINDIKTNSNCEYYAVWNRMLRRCYSDEYKKQNKTYSDCSVCDEWLLFSNFKKWMQCQNWANKDLDKDLLYIGNKEYSPDKCIFIDHGINTLINFYNYKNATGFTGVYYDKRKHKYGAECGGGEYVNKKFLGYYDTPEQAHAAYVAYKSKLIREVAETQEPRVKSGLIRHAEALENSVEEQK